MPEWSNGADSKSVEPFGVPRVRIPISPPLKGPDRNNFTFSGDTQLWTALLIPDIAHYAGWPSLRGGKWSHFPPENVK